jgi:uncharacterized low-complexity protein
MIKMLIVAATLFLAVAPACAQFKSAAEEQDFLRASGVCQASVNDQRTRGRGVAGSKSFKAQADTDGTVNTVGTDQARFEYEKCMAGQGHPVRSTKP